MPPSMPPHARIVGMSRLHIAVVAVLLSAPSLARAQAWKAYLPSSPTRSLLADCAQTRPRRAGSTQAYAGSLGSGLCFLSIQSMESTDLVYRSYGLFSDGVLLVFNSFCDGPVASCTGAREFHFFPRRGALKLHIDPAVPSVAATLEDGGLATFDPATAQLASLERGEVVVDPNVDPGNQGGVEIPRYAGLMLDAGFRMGELPSGKPGRTSTFRDAAGNTCTVTNSEIFAYANGDRALKFDDAGLTAFLAGRCPGLNASGS